jgi:hypothetical protein
MKPPAPLPPGSSFRYPAALVAALWLGGGACDLTGDGHPPVARISADPGVILEFDNFQTPVTLDATGSADPIDDPDGQRPLSYQWAISGDEHRFDQGGLASPSPQVRFRGARPATIELTVTDEDGLSSTARLQLKLTVR